MNKDELIEEVRERIQFAFSVDCMYSIITYTKPTDADIQQIVSTVLDAVEEKVNSVSNLSMHRYLQDQILEAINKLR